MTPSVENATEPHVTPTLVHSPTGEPLPLALENVTILWQAAYLRIGGVDISITEIDRLGLKYPSLGSP